jgi:hypothetical protein
MNNQNPTARGVDAWLWGAKPEDSGVIGDRDSMARAVVHMGWHGINTAANAVKETVTGDWDYKGTSREAGRVRDQWGQAKKGPSPLRGRGSRDSSDD